MTPDNLIQILITLKLKNKPYPILEQIYHKIINLLH